MDSQIRRRAEPCLRGSGEICLLFHLSNPCANCAPHVPDFMKQVGVLTSAPPAPPKEGGEP